MPAYREETQRLAELLKAFSPWQLESLMKISPDLALRAHMDFQNFHWDNPGSPALLSYHGLAYQNLSARDFTLEDFAFAQNHLRILSAFYGLLRPTDALQPYRLELGCRWKVDGKSLYHFWGDKLCRDLFAPGEPVINLASGEYSKAVIPHLRPGDRMITCDFLVNRRGRLTCLATGAKMARGQMARFLIKNRLRDPEQLQAFDWEDYAFVPALSTESKYVFVQQ